MTKRLIPKHQNPFARLEANQQAAREFTNRVVSNVREQKKRVDKEDKRLQQAIEKSKKRYGYPSDVARIQDQLYRQGYFGDIDYDKAVDGVWGKMSQDAWMKRQLEKTNTLPDTPPEDKSILGIPTTWVINNLFPYGYDNSRVSKKSTNAVNKVLSKMGINDSGIGESIGGTIGGVYKVSRGLFGADKAANAMREFADLDLSKPENRERAEELLRIAAEDEPKWGLHGGSLEHKQRSVRARYDQNYLHGGQPQRYGTFSLENGYDTSDGIRTYGYADPVMQRSEQNFIRNYVKNNKFTRMSENGRYVWEVPGGDPFAAHSNFSIVADDEKGTNARSFDDWDFGRGNVFSSKNLPGMKQILVGVKAR